MKNFFIITGFLLGGSFILTQCTRNQGNPVGSRFFQRTNPGSEKQNIFQAAVTDTFYHTSVNTGASSYLYVGQNGNDRVRTLICFTNLPDSGSLDSTVVTLYTSRIMGKAEGILTTSVHTITKEWKESEITWSTFEPDFIGEEILTLEIPSTLSDSISFPLPLSLIRSWMDSLTASQNYGIVLTSSSASFMVEFFSRHVTNGPNLTLYLTQDTTQTIASSTDAFIATTYENPTPDRLFIANGTALRTLLFFDLSSIPAEATINRALLTLHSDTSLSVPNHSEPFDLLVYTATNSPWPIPSVPYDSTISITGNVEDDSVTINVTSTIQNWSSGKNENHGFLLVGKSEKSNLSRRAFYSTSADSVWRPRMEVFYSLPPSTRF